MLKTLLNLVVAACLVGCVNMAGPRPSDGCCGLTKAQWENYRSLAVSAMQSQAVQGYDGKVVPRERLLPDDNPKLSGSTDSPDGKTPPKTVTIQIRLQPTYPFDLTHVVVEFSHPSQQIMLIYATEIMY